MSGEAKTRDLIVKNNEGRIIVLSCKDPRGRGIKKFICVPTKPETIPAEFVPSLMKNKQAVELMKRLEVTEAPKE